MFKKTVLTNFVSAFLLAGVLAAGTAQAQQPAKPELKVGFVPGPYIDEFKAGVAPELQKKGYRARYVEFSTGLEANNAVFKNEIDANVMQYTMFLNSYNDRQQTDLVGIVHVPTPSHGTSISKAPDCSGALLSQGTTASRKNVNICYRLGAQPWYRPRK
jgi:D-methionine transport system substrate-binding protein